MSLRRRPCIRHEHVFLRKRPAQRVWPASVALAQFVAENAHLVRGKRVVEVGAGISGLPSLAAARAVS